MNPIERKKYLSAYTKTGEATNPRQLVKLSGPTSFHYVNIFDKVSSF